MMKKFANKLKDNTGASLILVLILFLMCTMVSSVIVATASSGASRNLKRKQQQQKYLSLMSAANLIAEEMKSENSGVFVGKTVLWDFGCNRTGERQHRNDKEVFHDTKCSDWTETGEFDAWEVDEATNLTGLLSDVLLEACTKVFVDREVLYETGFWIRPEDDRLVDVYCKFTMDFNFDIAIYFSTDGTSYAMTLHCEANPETVPVSDDTQEHNHNMDYLYTDEETGEISTKTGLHNVGATKLTKTTTVTWTKLKQVLRKGEN